MRLLLRLLVPLLLPWAGQAILRDRSPLPDSNVIGWPQWYRDTNNLALGLCKSQINSVAAPGSPICFPIDPNPAGFAGNIGDEIFYNILQIDVETPGITLLYIAALEAAYGSPDGSPVTGSEVVFTRIRIRADVTVAGDYTIIHPFGREVFTGVAPGTDAIKFTRDIGIAPRAFDEALNGDLGPFVEWVNAAGTGRTEATEVLNFVDPATGRTERFVGDPNVLHRFRGSPTGFNRLRIEAPRGGIGVGGTDGIVAGRAIQFIEETLGTVMGQEWGFPIPTPFLVQGAIYGRSASAGFIADVWATSAPGQELIVTGPTLPSVIMAEGTGGSYYAHIQLPAATPITLPLLVTVYNTRSNPINSQSVPLVDNWVVSSCVFDRATGVLTVSATSSDTVTPPTLDLVAPVGPLAFTRAAATGVYSLTTTLTAFTVVAPQTIRIRSSSGAVVTANVLVINVPMNVAAVPTANDDSLAVNGALATQTLAVLANDVVSSAAATTTIVLAQPARFGTISPTIVAAGGPLSLAVAAGLVAGSTDTFPYLLKVGTTVSRVARVNLLIGGTVNPTLGAPPTAVADRFFVAAGTTSTPFRVTANDIIGVPNGSPINPASVLVIQGTVGRAAVDATGAVTFTAPATVGIFTFQYTVASTTGATSQPAVVSADVRAAAEVITITRGRFRAATGRWVVTGTSTWFAAGVSATTVTCSWTRCATAARPCLLPTIVPIGSGPVDGLGAWTVDVAGATDAPTADNLVSIDCRSSNGATASTGATRIN